MSPRTIFLLLTPLALVVALYLAAGFGLFMLQRRLIFPAPTSVIDSPPAGSIYRVLPVQAPTGGRLMVWMAPTTRPGLPTFVFFHGNGSDISDFAQVGEVFHRRGWGIVLAAYRGYSGNSGKPTEGGLMEDARAILNALGSTKGPIVLWGHSLGSGVAARMASEGRGAALVLESPYTSVADVAAGMFRFFPVRWLISDRFDTLALVPKIKAPVLIIHGADDRQIPVAMARTLATTFGKQATLDILQNAGHYPHGRDLSGATAAWLKKVGIGDPPPP